MSPAIPQSITAAAWLTCLLTGCAPSARYGDFYSPDPAARLYAAHRAGSSHDRTSIKHLIEQLESDDPALRMVAINALHRITGTRLGYNPYALRTERSEAIDRWVQAARDGRFESSATEPSTLTDRTTAQ